MRAHLHSPKNASQTRTRGDESNASELTKSSGTISHVVIGVAFAGPHLKLHGTPLILPLADVVTYMPQASIAVASMGNQMGARIIEEPAVSGRVKARRSVVSRPR